MNEESDQFAFTAKSVLNLPRKWYSNHFLIEFDLLESFMDISEEEINLSMAKFQNGKQLHIIEKDDLNIEIVEVYKCVTNETFELDTIFKNYFPDLKRKSNFIIIISFLETSLLEFCEQLNTEFQIRKPVNGRNNVFNNIELFLFNELKLQFTASLKKNWNQLKVAYKIRNKIIHSSNIIINEIVFKDFEISFETFEFTSDTNTHLINYIKAFLIEIETQLLKM